jgi:uncharacterized protein with FMN-binding domain
MSSTLAAGTGSDGARTARPTRGKPSVRANGGKKIGTDLLVLSSVAILSVYGIGYQRTLAGANAIAALDSPAIAQASADSVTPTPIATTIATVAARVGLSQPALASPTGTAATTPTASAPTAGAVPTTTVAPKVVVPTATVAKSGLFRDGTYVGQGFSRHGGIEATVVVTAGKIVSADITACSTRYPCSDAYPLIPEVVSRQAAPIHHVSGATDSSNAYRDAVIKALSLAA